MQMLSALRRARLGRENRQGSRLGREDVERRRLQFDNGAPHATHHLPIQLQVYGTHCINRAVGSDQQVIFRNRRFRIGHARAQRLLRIP